MDQQKLFCPRTFQELAAHRGRRMTEADPLSVFLFRILAVKKQQVRIFRKRRKRLQSLFVRLTVGGIDQGLSFVFEAHDDRSAGVKARHGLNAYVSDPKAPRHRAQGDRAGIVRQAQRPERRRKNPVQNLFGPFDGERRAVKNRLGPLLQQARIHRKADHMIQMEMTQQDRRCPVKPGRGADDAAASVQKNGLLSGAQHIAGSLAAEEHAVRAADGDGAPSPEDGKFHGSVRLFAVYKATPDIRKEPELFLQPAASLFAILLGGDGFRDRPAGLLIVFRRLAEAVAQLFDQQEDLNGLFLKIIRELGGVDLLHLGIIGQGHGRRAAREVFDHSHLAEGLPLSKDGKLLLLRGLVIGINPDLPALNFKHGMRLVPLVENDVAFLIYQLIHESIRPFSRAGSVKAQTGHVEHHILVLNGQQACL